MQTFTRELTLVWGDCDDAGIVFYPNYFYWFDGTYHLYLRSRGMGMRDIKAQFGAVTPLVDVGAKFFAPISYEDTVQIQVRVAEWMERRFRLEYLVMCGDKKIASGHEVRAWAQFEDQAGHSGRLRGAAVPQAFKALFEG